MFCGRLASETLLLPVVPVVLSSPPLPPVAVIIGLLIKNAFMWFQQRLLLLHLTQMCFVCHYISSLIKCMPDFALGSVHMAMKH